MRASPVLRFVATAALLSGSLTLVGCGGDSGGGDGASPQDGRTPLVIDTDLAGEGIMSVLYLLGREEFDVRAITVSGTGLVHGEVGANQALGLLELAGAGDIPVAFGPAEPLAGTNAFPREWRTAADEAYGVTLPQGGVISGLTAPELLVQVIEDSADPVVLYTDGPLTNLAAALRLEPGIVENISSVFSMGGALDVVGTVDRNPAAEWNIWIDPTAATEVLTSGLTVTLVPLDATNQVPLNVFHLQALQQHADSPTTAAVVALLEGNEQLQWGALYFWDQLTAALLADESLASFETVRIAITEGAPSTGGATVRASDGVEVRIPTTIDVERFERDFLSALAGAEIGTIWREADLTASYNGSEWTFDAPDSVPPGTYALEFTNTATTEAAVAIGWVSGDVTEEEVRAWSSAQQPPWLELDSLLLHAPGTAIGAVRVTEPGTRYVFGLLMTSMTAVSLGKFEVTG